jgi:hypothetical protein
VDPRLTRRSLLAAGTVAATGALLGAVPVTAGTGQYFYRSGVLSLRGSGEKAVLSVLVLSAATMDLRLRILTGQGVVKKSVEVSPVGGPGVRTITFDPTGDTQLRGEVRISSVAGSFDPDEEILCTLELRRDNRTVVVLEQFKQRNH